LGDLKAISEGQHTALKDQRKPQLTDSYQTLTNLEQCLHNNKETIANQPKILMFQLPMTFLLTTNSKMSENSRITS
jgi:hypothetical protein